jgi:hypothetical protein
LLEKYASIREILRMSCATGDGLERCEQALAGLAEDLAAEMPPLPERWALVAERLERHSAPRIDSDAYAGICRDVGITNAAEQAALLDYLADVGDVLVLAGRPASTVVLKPAWLVDAIYAITRAELVRERGGRVRCSSLDGLLPYRAYRGGGVALVVQAMVRHDYAFLQADTLVIPSLLPDLEAKLPSVEGRMVALVFDLPYLPPYLASRFLARLGPDALGKRIWRTGAILRHEHSSSVARVRIDREQQRIALEVWGEAPRDYLSVLRHRLLTLLDALPVADVQERVPLPGSTQVVDYEHLRALEAGGERRYFDPRERTNYSVQLLLSGREEMESDSSGDTNVYIGSNVSYGGGFNLIVGSEGLAALANLKQAISTSQIPDRDLHLAAITEAEKSGDRARLRAAVLASLDAGAKVGAIATAAGAVLGWL